MYTFCLSLFKQITTLMIQFYYIFISMANTGIYLNIDMVFNVFKSLKTLQQITKNIYLNNTISLIIVLY